jgi:hypothetical protein
MSRARKGEVSALAAGDDPRLELAHRVADGIEVQLLYAAADETVAVLVHEFETGVCLELPVDPAEALKAFYHPYAYAARRSVASRGPRSASSKAEQAWFAPRSAE